jgi:hypothetical protein
LLADKHPHAKKVRANEAFSSVRQRRQHDRQDHFGGEIAGSEQQQEERAALEYGPDVPR